MGQDSRVRPLPNTSILLASQMLSSARWMSLLELTLAETLPSYVEEVRELMCQHGAVPIGSVSVAQAYSGMRGVNALVYDTSEVHSTQGLIIRGIPLGIC